MQEDLGDAEGVENPLIERTEVYGNVPRIELRQLRYFLAVADELNFTRAAEKMGIAQPPLSQQILILEQQMKVKLFERNRRHVALTREGEAFIVYARRIINNTRIAAELMSAIKRGEDGPLSIGAIFSANYLLVPQLFEPFAEQYPKVRIHLQEMTVVQQLAALREERIDIGILRGPIDEPDIETLTMIEEPFVVVLSNRHPLALEKELSADQVRQQPLIRVIPSVNRNYSHQMFSALEKEGQALNIEYEVADTHTLMGLVAANFGISMVPESLRTLHTDRLRYIPLKEKTPKTLVQLAWKRDFVSQTLPAFLKIAREMAVRPE